MVKFLIKLIFKLKKMVVRLDKRHCNVKHKSLIANFRKILVVGSKKIATEIKLKKHSLHTLHTLKFYSYCEP